MDLYYKSYIGHILNTVDLCYKAYIGHILNTVDLCYKSYIGHILNTVNLHYKAYIGHILNTVNLHYKAYIGHILGICISGLGKSEINTRFFCFSFFHIMCSWGLTGLHQCVVTIVICFQ